MPTVVISPVGGAGAQFFNNNGAVLSGGLIYTYVAGTTTLATTYTTSAGTVARTNPVVLDSAGRVSGDGIWLTYQTAYKFVIKTSTGTTIQTLDNITGSTAVTAPIVYDIRTYGALTSLANNTTAINLAIAAASAAGGGDVFIPGGTWPCTTQITLLDGVNLVGAGYDAHLSFASAGSIGTCIKALGSIAAVSPVFSVSIAKGDDTITFGSAPNVVAGDIIVLYNSADSSWSAARTYYRAGEFCRVASVSGSTVTLESPMFDSYTTGSTTIVYKMSPVTVDLRGFSATFKTGLIGIGLEFGYRCHVSDLNLTGSDYSNLELSRCYESAVTNLDVVDASSAAAGLNYGLSIMNSQRVVVSDSQLVTTRHGITTGGDSSTGCVPVREVLIDNCIVGGRTAGVVGADFHGNIEYATYQNCELTHGVNIAGDYTSILGCMIRPLKDTSSYGVYAAELLGPNHVIQGNRIVATAALTGTSGALVNICKNNTGWSSCVRSGVLTIADNDLDLQTFDGDPLDVRNVTVTATTAQIDLVIVGNRIHGTGTQTGRLANVAGNSTCGFRTVDFSRNNLIGCTLRLNATGAQVMTVNDNTVARASVEGVVIVGGSAYHTTYQTEEELIFVERNNVYRPQNVGISVGGSDTGVRSYAFIRNNVSVSSNQGGTSGSSSTDSSLYVLTVALAVVDRNVMGKLPNDSVGAQVRYWAANAVTTLVENGNYNVGSIVTRNTTSVTNRTLDTFFAFNFSGVPGAAAIYTHIITRRCTIPATAPSSYAKAGTAATNSTTFDIAVNGVAKGTFVWSAAGTVATFTVAADVPLAAGDILTITTENPADGTLANIGGALAAYTY